MTTSGCDRVTGAHRGGTYDVDGILFINPQSWAHVVDAASRRVGLPREELLSPDELGAVDGSLSPKGVIY